MTRKAMLIGALWLLAISSWAAEQARIPYELVFQIQQRESDLTKSYTNLQMFLRMKSSRPEVRVSDLSVFIDSTNGPIPVRLDTNGAFSVPMRESLVEEKAMIVVNQPKGTMEFGWYVGLVDDAVPTNGIRYNVMMRPLLDLEAIRTQMVANSPTLTIQGLKFIYPPEKDATVVIHAKSGDRVIKTDPSHTLVVPWEVSLQEENPAISISTPPDRIRVAEPDDK